MREERLELSILSALASKTRVYTIPPLAHLVAGVGFEPTMVVAYETPLVTGPYLHIHVIPQGYLYDFPRILPHSVA